MPRPESISAAKRAAEQAAADKLEADNRKIKLAFRKQVAAHMATHQDREIIARYAAGDGEDQTLFELSKRKDGRMFIFEAYGDCKTFPRAARLKRAGNPLERDQEDGEEEEVEVQARQQEQEVPAEQEIVDDWDREEARRAAAMGARRAEAAASKGKRQKKSATTSASGAASVPLRRTREASAGPSRRSARVARQSGGGADFPTPDTIRENEQEHHVGNYESGLASGRDDLASLLNGLEGCEIKSEIGSESTRIFSREDSMVSVAVA